MKTTALGFAVLKHGGGNMNKTIGEQQITPQLLKKVAPDVVSPQGQQQLIAKQVAAKRLQGIFDKALQIASDRLGGTSNTRIKQVDTMSKKIAQKRLAGRNYGINNINDAIGGRLIVDKSKIGDAKDEVSAMEKAGLFKIKKTQEVKDGNYRAWHADIILPNGTKGELQIHTPQSALEAVSNHTMRAQFGDNEPKVIDTLKNAQAKVAKKIPNEKAVPAMKMMQAIEQQQGGKINPIQSSAILAMAKQS